MRVRSVGERKKKQGGATPRSKTAIQPGAEDAGRKKQPAKRPIGRNAERENLRVLIVEDSAADTALMERELKKSNFNFVAQRVEDESAFRKALKAFKPDLILADYSLPKFDAMQALELSKSEAAQTPFIIITGTISEEIAVECMKRGADDYLLKDRLTRLGEAVRHALEKRRLQEEKRAAEDSLRVSELLHRTFLDSSSDMAFLKDDQCRHLLANRALCNFYGKTEKQIIGKTDFELMERKAARKCEESDQQALAENSVHVSEETIGDRVFETRKFPVKLADGRIGVGGYIRDISAQIQAESKIYESEARYRLISENSGDVIWILDIASQRFTFVSPSVFKLRGLTPQQVMAQPMAAALTQESYQSIVAKLPGRIAALAAGDESARVWTNEVDQVRKDGSIVHTEVVTTLLTDADGRATEIMGVTRDISERKRAQEMLQATSRRLELALESAKAGTWDWDVISGTIEWSPQMFTLLGLEPKANGASFASWLNALHPEDRELAKERIELALKQRKNLNSDYRVELPSGQFRWINALGEGLYNDAGQPIQMIGICQDITERKHAEAQIQKSLQEKEVLLKEIHHRVKNNLQVISGLLTLQAAQMNDERLQKMIQESQSRIWTMALIHQTLYQSGNLADIDMSEYIRNLCGNLLSSYAQVAMPPTITFELTTIRLIVDKAIPLALIINELVTNAMKHAFAEGQPGEILISLQERTGAARRAPTDHVCAPMYELTVADNGSGLPAGFDPREQKSLGLQLVAMLTKQLGGTLTFASSGGTSVRIGFSDHEKSEKHS